MKKFFRSFFAPLLTVFMILPFVFSSCKSEEEAELVSIYVSQDPKTKYSIGESLDLTGVVVTAKYSDGSEQTVNDWTSTPPQNTQFKTAGTVLVTITYKEKSTILTIAVRNTEGTSSTEQNLYTNGSKAASLIASLGEDGSSTVHITGTVTSDDIANISEAIKTLKVGVSIDFSDASFATIPENAFEDCKMLKGIVIPACVTSIGNYAFNGCTGLKTVEIEDGEGDLTLGINNDSGWYSNEGKGLFRQCPLETLHLGRNIIYEYSDKSSDTPFTRYGYSAFASISTLTTVTISVPSGLNSFTIGKYAFKDCLNINSATFTTPKAEIWEWFTSSSSSTTSTGTTVDINTASDGATFLKNLGENYLHGKRTGGFSITNTDSNL